VLQADIPKNKWVIMTLPELQIWVCDGFEPRLPSISENFQHSLCRLTGNQSAVDLTNLYDMGEDAPLLLS